MVLMQLELWQILVLFMPFLLNVFGIWHAYSHTFPTPVERIGWLLACVMLPFLGGVIYLLFGIRRVQPC